MKQNTQNRTNNIGLEDDHNRLLRLKSKVMKSDAKICFCYILICICLQLV